MRKQISIEKLGINATDGGLMNLIQVFKLLRLIVSTEYFMQGY